VQKVRQGVKSPNGRETIDEALELVRQLAWGPDPG
jgi:hypothetical protein